MIRRHYDVEFGIGLNLLTSDCVVDYFGQENERVDQQADIVVTEVKEKPQIGDPDAPAHKYYGFIFDDYWRVEPTDVKKHPNVQTPGHTKKCLWAHFPKQTPQPDNYLCHRNDKYNCARQYYRNNLMPDVGFINAALPPHHDKNGKGQEGKYECSLGADSSLPVGRKYKVIRLGVA